MVNSRCCTFLRLLSILLRATSDRRRSRPATRGTSAAGCSTPIASRPVPLSGERTTRHRLTVTLRAGRSRREPSGRPSVEMAVLCRLPGPAMVGHLPSNFTRPAGTTTHSTSSTIIRLHFYPNVTKFDCCHKMVSVVCRVSRECIVTKRLKLRWTTWFSLKSG